MTTKSSLVLYKTTTSGLLLAIAMLLPFLTGQIPTFGNMLLPMHIPVILCGFVCGAPYGAAVGFLAPLMRSFIFGAPLLFPSAVTMAFELCTYGLVSGILYSAFPKKIGYTYLSLIIAMIAGRGVLGIASVVVYQIMGSAFSVSMFIGGAFTNALPGIVLQLVFIPILVKLSHQIIKFK